MAPNNRNTVKNLRSENGQDAAKNLECSAKINFIDHPAKDNVEDLVRDKGNPPNTRTFLKRKVLIQQKQR